MSNTCAQGLQVRISPFSGYPGAILIDQALQRLFHLLPRWKWGRWGVEVSGNLQTLSAGIAHYCKVQP